MKKFLKDLIVDVFTDERTQQALDNLLGRLITKQFLPLLPVAAGAAGTAAVNEALKRFPGLEHVGEVAVDAVHATEQARNSLNELLPDVDFGIPALDNLIDFWRPK